VARGWRSTSTPRATGPRAASTPLVGNSFGLFEAILGYIAGFVAAEIGLAVYGALAHRSHVVGYAADIAGLVGLWSGFLVGALVAVRRVPVVADPPGATDRGVVAAALHETYARFATSFGLSLRWIDIPLGIVAGLAGQYLVVPLTEAPLIPFVPHLFQRLSGPADSITGGVTGGGLVVLCLLVCLGTPFFEELFFRGLVLRGFLGALQRRGNLGARPAVVLGVLASAVVFGLAHFELLELPGLIGAGIVFATLAVWTRRLGPGMVAHATFNAVTLLAIVHGR
jgi:hypothetical protein